MAGDQWIEFKLADACCSIDYGLTASATDSADAPRFLRITDIVSGAIDWKTVPSVVTDQTTVEKYRLDDGDIVIARTGASTGASAYVKKPPSAVFASYLVRLKTKSDFDSRYVAYYLKSDAFWCFIRGVLGDKSAQPNASASTMTQALLRAPKNKETQRAIAHILGTLDDKIELNRKMNETLEAMAQAIFKSWFVDFDPVRAKAEGRQPNGLDPEIAKLFPDSFQSSDIGEIPKGWGPGEVGNLAKLYREGLNPGEYCDEVFDHYSIPSFDEGRMPKADVGKSIKSNKFIVPQDSVLLSKLNPRIPRIWLTSLRGPHRAVCSTEFLVILPKPDISVEYLFCFFCSNNFINDFATLVTGTSGSHQRVKPENLLEMKTITPSDVAIEQFTKLTKPLLKLVNHNIEESHTLASLRDVLLPKLLSGEIRVKDAEKFVEKSET
jgi:type I restriction enzyme S subunit